jgi:hypothetical protein
MQALPCGRRAAANGQSIPKGAHMLVKSHLRQSITALVVSSLVMASGSALAAKITWSKWTDVPEPPPAGMHWQFVAGDFDSDGDSDVVGYNPGTGKLHLGKNNGSTFVFSVWGQVSPAAGWTFVPGDFTGDGRIDVLGYFVSPGTLNDGSLWIGTNTGSGFNFGSSYWNKLSPTSGWTLAAGKMSGNDAKADLLAYYYSNQSLWVGRSSVVQGTPKFVFSTWATLPTNTDGNHWYLQSADFADDPATTLDDHLDDALAYQPSTGVILVGRNDATDHFQVSEWRKSLSATFTAVAGTFNGDGRADVGLYSTAAGGGMYFARNSGDRFANVEQVASINPATSWTVTAGDFVSSLPGVPHDALSDFFAYYYGTGPGNGGLWVGRNEGGASPEGYVWPLSAAPGGTLSFMVSGYLQPTVTFYRHEARIIGAPIGETISTVPTIEGTNPIAASQPRPLPSSAWASDQNWPVALIKTIPPTWTSGIYSARIVQKVSGETFDITFVVKPNPASHSNIALIANVNTWNAYNKWGGKSKYGSGVYGDAALTTLKRPNPAASPVLSGFDQNHLAHGELWILSWLTSLLGHPPDVYTDLDYDYPYGDAGNAVTRAKGYDAIVLSTHPEYWTLLEWANLRSFLDDGGTLLYLGGNGIFESMSYGPQNCHHPDCTQGIYLNGQEGGPRAPALFRTLGLDERSLLGVQTAKCLAVNADTDRAYDVLDLQHPIMVGANITTSPIGAPDRDAGIVGASGHEIDRRTYDSNATNGWLPCGLTPPEMQGPPPTLPLPANLVVLAEGQDQEAEMVYYTKASGGFVFSVGSIYFGMSLLRHAELQRLLGYVLGLI